MKPAQHSALSTPNSGTDPAPAPKRRAGRPRIPGLKRVLVMLDPETVEKARALGGGKVSLGIRRRFANYRRKGKK
jgi:hypothetical protein